MARLLLIDDDELLRDAVLQMLELDGHEVVEAGDGERALQLFGTGERFDAAITDVLMPGMDGARLIVELRRRRPELPIVAISGGRRMLSPQFNLETAGLAGAECRLPKPFSRRELQEAVGRALTAGAVR